MPSSKRVEPQQTTDSQQHFNDGFPSIQWNKKDDVILTSMAGEPVRLSDLWKDGRRVVFVFLRRFECQTCLTYIILFAHLRPILQKSNIRLIFITCHNDLTEVNTFLLSFAFWMKKLKSDSDSSWEKRGYRTVEKASLEGDPTSGALPGELYLDPDRNSYKFFGLTNSIDRLQNLTITFMCLFWLRNKLLFPKKLPGNAEKASRTMLYWKSRRRIAQLFLQFKFAGFDVFNQSPGIVAVEKDRVLYRYICKDQFNTVPKGSNADFANALACQRPEVELMDTVVTDGLREFCKTFDAPENNGDVKQDEFKILSRLGNGRESEVYCCKWMGMKVAVKFFKVEDDDDDDDSSAVGNEQMTRKKLSEGIRSFANEAAILMSLRNDHVIPLFGFGTQPPRQFLITELMPRGTLFSVLATPSIRLDSARRHSFLMGIAWGMLYLHSCSPPIIHQDLKSLNVLVAEDWTVKISDLGIARVLRMQSRKRKQKQKSSNAEESDGSNASLDLDEDAHGLYFCFVVLTALSTHCSKLVQFSGQAQSKFKEKNHPQSVTYLPLL
ncbi:hypothetical protein HDU97_001923 [Phlyctochytrium planicorne]|nr:hypothetical protein HDU97_001923 [Phlyctochytrium planicorne]